MSDPAIKRKAKKGRAIVEPKDTVKNPPVPSTDVAAPPTAAATPDRGSMKDPEEGGGEEDDETDYRYRKRRIESNASRYDHASDDETDENAAHVATAEVGEEEEEDVSWIIEKQKSRIADTQYRSRGAAIDQDDDDADVDLSLKKFSAMGQPSARGPTASRASRKIVIVPREEQDQEQFVDLVTELRRDAVQASTLRASANRFRGSDTGITPELRTTAKKGGRDKIQKGYLANAISDKGVDDQSFLDALL